MAAGIYFEVETPLGVKIRTTKDYWQKITTIKHPSVAGHEDDAVEALRNPDQIRRSNQDPRVHLYYRSIGKLDICVVVDHTDDTSGYVMTAYLTDRIKEGEQIYVKS